VKLPRRQRDRLPAGLGVNLAALAGGVSVNLEALGLADGSEAEFQAVVVQIAERGGWAAFSVPDSRRATAGGFQDTTFMRDVDRHPWPWVVVAELKRDGEEPRPDQVAWLRAWEAMGVPAYCWRPSDLETIRRVLA
jgi:hypothetical protein